MRIEKVRLYNFCQHADTSIDFSGGVIGVVGPNGSGKSNLVRAIATLIHGDFPKEKDRCLRAGSDSGYIEGTFVINDIRLVIYRSIDKGTVKIQFPGQTREDIKGAKKVNEFIFDLLKTEKQILQEIVFVGQKEIANLLFAPQSERDRIMQKFFGLDKANKIESAISLVINSINIDENISSIIQATEDSVKSFRERLAAIDGELSGRTSDSIYGLLDQNRKSLNAYLEGKAAIEGRAFWEKEKARLEGDLKSLEGKVAGLSSKAISSEIEKLNLRVDRAQKLSGWIDSYRYSQKSLGEAKIKIESIRTSFEVSLKEITKVREMKIKEMLEQSLTHEQNDARGQELLRVINEKSGELANTPLPDTDRLEKKKLELLDLQKKHTQIQTRRDESHKLLESCRSGRCPLCKNIVSEEHLKAQETILTELNQEILVLDKIIPAVTKEIVELEKTNNQVVAKRNQLQAIIENNKKSVMAIPQKPHGIHPSSVLRQALAKQEELERNHAILEASLKECREAYDKGLALFEDAKKFVCDKDGNVVEPDNISELTTNIQNLQKDYAYCVDMERRLEQLRTSVNSANIELNKFSVCDIPQIDPDKTRALIESLDQEAKLVRDLEVERVGVQNSLNTSISSLQTYKEKQEKEHEKALYKMALDDLRNQFRYDGAPRQLVMQNLVLMQGLINTHLGALQVPFRVEVGEGLTFKCIFKNGVTMFSDELSGGQETVLSLAFRLAACETFASSMGMLVLDEPTVWIDENTKSLFPAIVSYLKDMASRFNMQFIIPTHEQGLIVHFDQVVDVSKK